jgi:adenosylhomocysteine nucleosidase
MVAESDCLATAMTKAPPDDRPLLFCAAASSARAFMGACALVEQGATGLVSFGLAGGLAPDLHPGALVVAEAVLDSSERRWQTTAAWRRDLYRQAAAQAGGLVFVSDKAICSVSEKADLYGRTGAVAVDMESGGVARAAEAAGVPFLVVRVVADPASRRLPQCALAGLGDDGRQRPLAALSALARRPWETPELFRVSLDNARAMRRLRSVAADSPSLFRAPAA